MGFPTIKYGDSNNLETYEGDRSLKVLKKFAKDNLGPRCGPANLDLCDEAKKMQIDGFMKMDAATLQELIDEKDEAIKKIDSDAEEFLKSLQEQYEQSTKEADEQKKEIKESGLGLMKSVAAHKKTAKSEL